MKTLMLNMLLFGAVCVVVPLVLRVIPKIPAVWGFPIALAAYIAAACILNDFAMRGADIGDTTQEIDLAASYGRAIHHTLTHPLWPLGLNVFFSLAFTALLVQARGNAAVPMALWLVCALAVPVVHTLVSKGWGAVAGMSWDLRIAFLLTIAACACFLKDAMHAQ